jgi:rhamnosyltransferase
MSSEASMMRLGVYAHFDMQDEVKPYVLYYLRALRPHCQRLVFVSTSKLPERELAKLDGLSDEHLLRDNVGYDFGMWRQVIERTDLSELDELLLTNSSIFGPLSPLSRVFDRMAGSACDFWGITDNFENHWHLQSYFLVFRKAALRSEAFARFWSSMLPYRDKWQTILSYELGLTTYLVESGLVGQPMVPCTSLFPSGPTRHLIAKKRRNPTCFHPLRLLRRGSPFVKVELLRDNPAEVPLRPIHHAMLEAGYRPELIAFDRPVKPHGLSVDNSSLA